MVYNYDALYATEPNALGAPTPAFVQFFETFANPVARVLDVGCGQGRDAQTRLIAHVSPMDWLLIADETAKGFYLRNCYSVAANRVP